MSFHRHEDDREHGHGHSYGDAHGHGHMHAHVSGPTRGRTFALAVALNLAFVAVEAGFGLWAKSLALLADASHNLSDAGALLLAWGAAALAARPPRGRFTYGFRGSTILAAQANAVTLFVATGAILWGAAIRFANPVPVNDVAVIAVAGVGVILNTVTALLLMSGAEGDLNVRSAFVHMASDAAISAGVAVAGAVMLWTGGTWLDPAAGAVISLVILATTWGLLRDSFSLALHAAPPELDVDALRAFLRELPGVREVHDFHVWAMSTTETALTAHLVTPGGHPGDGFLERAADELKNRFRVSHSTLQLEHDGATCRLAPEGVV